MVEGGGEAEVGGELVVEVTLMASCWPEVQCWGKVHVKKCSPAVERVILAGLLVMWVMVVVVLHESNAVLVSFATSWVLFRKLNSAFYKKP